MKYVLMGITLLLCLSASFAQDVRYLEHIGKAAFNDDREIQARTEKYLTRLSRSEQRLYSKLYKIDSVKARTLFTESIAQYDGWLGRLTNTGAGYTIRSSDYLPGLDSLQTGINFLSRDPKFLSS